MNKPLIYEPLTITIPAAQIISIKSMLQCGKEYAQECLDAHELALGRTTQKNKRLAAMMERDIAQIDDMLIALPDVAGLEQRKGRG